MSRREARRRQPEMTMVAAPLDGEQLLARSDLAGIARVLSSQNAHATLRFKTLLKGRLQGRGVLARFGLQREAVVRLRGMTMIEQEGGAVFLPALGGWTDEDAYRPGSLVRTHLIWNAKDRVYETLWWNAVTRLR